MGTFGHSAQRTALSIAYDTYLKRIDKNGREKELVRLTETVEKYLGDFSGTINYDRIREIILDPDCPIHQYINRVLDEVDPQVLKTSALNFGFEAMYHGTKTIRNMRQIHQCNVPWLILMDPLLRMIR